MFILVLTGGLGAGKSTAARHLAGRGATVLDLDDIAARVLTKDSPLLSRLADEFGDDVLFADGSLDRAALARVGFSSAEAAATLNSIVHPAVAREVGPALTELRLLPDRPEVVVLEVPLLAEAPVYRELADGVVAIVAPEGVRVARAVERGMDEAEAKRRIRVQATDAQRAELADKVLVNDGDEAAFLDELDRYWDSCVAMGGSLR